MAPARSFLAAVSVLFALCASSTTAAAVAPNDWKLAVGWNQTVLPSLGTSVGTFTPPAGAIPAQAASKLAATAAVSALGKPGGVFICQNLDWKGLCGYAVEPMNECILLADPWLKTITSFGPDPGATCFAFASGDCNTANAQWSFKFPGDDTGGLSTTNPFNDKITSFACVPS
ncbi:hypothetical protein B0H14DRAFT_3443826 [Mycena olivaceomarginata]|nr:hypothetical protein B0H14DRAFT_3443826 [Mycena olivaceomarginata]